ncbi:endonuclease V [Candidatus Pacearchaeota archaeon]|nr:MAG: endonuclease V [Candidatus Pacearchaeota archaeon]
MRNLSLSDIDFHKLIEIQKKISQKIILKPVNLRNIKYVGGADASYIKGEELIIGVITVFSYPDLRFLEYQYCVDKVNFPYIPTFLSFREAPVLEKTWLKLKIKPEVLLVDGQGIAHPRRAGIASVIGVDLNIPTVGIAKSHLWGKYEKLNILKRGNYKYIYEHNEILGVIICTKDGVKPLYVSPGNLCDINSAIDIVISTAINYKLPEPLRMADILSKKLKRGCKKNVKKAMDVGGTGSNLSQR